MFPQSQKSIFPMALMYSLLSFSAPGLRLTIFSPLSLFRPPPPSVTDAFFKCVDSFVCAARRRLSTAAAVVVTAYNVCASPGSYWWLREGDQFKGERHC